MSNFPPVPPNPKKPKTPYEIYVQIAGVLLGTELILIGIGNMYFLTSPTVNLTEIARILLLSSEYIFMLVGAVLLGIFVED